MGTPLTGHVEILFRCTEPCCTTARAACAHFCHSHWSQPREPIDVHEGPEHNQLHGTRHTLYFAMQGGTGRMYWVEPTTDRGTTEWAVKTIRYE
jgi:hypothetical protein